MPYGYHRNTGHGRRAPRYRYAPDCTGDFAPRRASYKSLVEGLIQLPFFVAGWGTLAVGAILYALVLALTHAIRRAKTGALRADANARKALRVLHEHARHGPPTPEMIAKYWTLSRQSLEGKILLGSLMGDLAVAVDASYVRGDDGEIVGRKGGIRGWLRRNAPEMVPHYKALMQYKALADKFRLACGVQEPDGAEEALGETIPEHAKTAADKPERNLKAAQLLKRCRTMAALDEAVCDALGLVRVRRRAA